MWLNVILIIVQRDAAQTTTTPWLYIPCRTLASFTANFHSSLLCAPILQFVTPILLWSSLTSSTHLNLGLPTLLLSSGVFWYNLFTTLSSLILSTCPSHLNLPFLFLLLCPILHIIDATQSSLFIILRVHSTCFGCQQKPSSAVHKTVTTASLQRGQGWPRWREAAVQKIWPVPEAVITVLCTPDDGCS